MARKPAQGAVGVLLADPTGDVRVMTARRVAAEFGRPGLSVAERNLAIDTFRLLARDPDVAVRSALAESLRDEPLVPHDVAHALALDDADVALPMLEHSIVLSDEDLIEVARARGSAHQRAVARRAQISPVLAGSIIDTLDEQAIHTLMRNPGAEVPETGYDAVLRMFDATSPVLAALCDHRFGALLRGVARHATMPAFLAERLIHRVADKVRAAFTACDHVAPDAVDTLVRHARERATVALLRHGREHDDAALARQLAKVGRLSVSLVLRAALLGHDGFVTGALAEASGWSETKVLAALKKRQAGTLTRLIAEAGLPSDAADALGAIVAAARATKFGGGLIGLGAFQRNALQRLGAPDLEAFVRGLCDATVLIGAGRRRLAS